jgi:hypothetical protein
MNLLSSASHAITADRNRQGCRKTWEGILFGSNHRSLTDNLPSCFSEEGNGKLKSQFNRNLGL